jgi:hypothetical protein
MHHVQGPLICWHMPRYAAPPPVLMPPSQVRLRRLPMQLSLRWGQLCWKRSAEGERLGATGQGSCRSTGGECVYVAPAAGLVAAGIPSA